MLGRRRQDRREQDRSIGRCSLRRPLPLVYLPFRLKHFLPAEPRQIASRAATWYDFQHEPVILDGTDARTRAKKRKLPAAMVAHQFKPGQVANPLGAGAIPKSKRELYREARKLALDKAPREMERLGELMESTDERVAVFASNSILDRAGLRAIDKPELDEERSKFDPSLLTPAQLRQLEAALRLYIAARRVPDAPRQTIDGGSAE